MDVNALNAMQTPPAGLEEKLKTSTITNDSKWDCSVLPNRSMIEQQIIDV